jgi:hypothetical protein
MIYDVFYVSHKSVQSLDWQRFKERFPTAKLIENVKEFNDIKRKAFTRFFWVVWDDVVVTDDFKFDYIVPKWDEQYTHVFRNGEYYDGICIFNKHIAVSEKEFRYRFFTNKKEIDITASRPVPYDRFKLTSYQEYTAALANSTTDMFWAVWPELEIIDDTVFSFYIPKTSVHDLSENHVFKNKFRNQATFTNGLVLFSKYKKVTEKEFDYRFLIEKKEHDKLVSKMKPYDVVFISYNEPNADANYNKLKIKFPNVKRVDGIKGIHNAHKAAAEQVETEMFWVVDADALIRNDFNFDYEVSRYDLETVHVWRSQNPINGLVYGYGGVKLLPTQLTLNMDMSKPDMTTSISSKFKAMPEISNITAFNTDEFNTWKSAFRECVKLSSQTIERQQSTETAHRLGVWTTDGADKPFGKYAIAGAVAGAAYGLRHAHNTEALRKINDFEWLNCQFKESGV